MTPSPKTNVLVALPEPMVTAVSRSLAARDGFRIQPPTSNPNRTTPGHEPGVILLTGEVESDLLHDWEVSSPGVRFLFVSTDPESVQTLAEMAGLDEGSWNVLRPEADPIEFRQAVRTAACAYWASRETKEARNAVDSAGRDRIADLEQANRELSKARDAAETASRIKSEFLANMSHEIRTPMYGVLGMTDLLLETGLSEVQRDYVTSVRKSGSMLLNILNDILDFSKIEAGKMELDPVPFGLRESVGDLLRMLGLRADERGVELLSTVDPGVPDSLVGDSLRLRQVLTNLVTNGVKFTEKGEVELTVRSETAPAGSDAAWIRFSVRDTGIGIPEEKKPSIFGAFNQADASTTRRYGGTGLGLTISRSLVEMMGGRIWFESETGKGSTFHFVLPFVRHGTSAAAPVDVTALTGMEVLVIDDNATNRRILGDMVRQWSMLPTLAESGPDGLAALRLSSEASRRFDVILLDCNMPEMDGFAVAAAIRNDPAMAGSTIMMLTSSDRTADARRSRELGLAAYLIKPISQPELLREIRRIVGSRRRDPVAEGSAQASNGPAEGPRLRVLVVDDVAVNRRIAQAKIEKLGHTVTQADGGARAVEIYGSRQFDIVFMDIQMPDVDGFEATAMIREVQARTGVRVPVVAMTAMAMKGDREKCLAAGLDDYISKPIEAGALERILGSVSPTADASPEPREPSRTVPAQVAESNPIPFVNPSSRGAFDPQTALPRCMGEEALLHELLAVYLADSASYLSNLREAWKASDQTRFVRAAHKLKGAISYFCSDELAAEARWLEETAARQGIAACAARLPQFEADVERMNHEASAFALRKAA
jgi:two-component system, sensor histidine kinase and response regulator